MRHDKRNRMMQVMQCFPGPTTVAHVTQEIMQDTELVNDLTGKQLGKVANIRHKAYMDGKSMTAGLDVIDGCLWVPEVGLIPLETLRQIKVTNTINVKLVESDNPSHSYDYHDIYRDEACTDRIFGRVVAMGLSKCWYKTRTSVTQYTLDAREEC